MKKIQVKVKAGSGRAGLKWLGWIDLEEPGEWRSPAEAPPKLKLFMNANEVGDIEKGITLKSVREAGTVDYISAVGDGTYILRFDYDEADPLKGAPGPSREGFISNMGDLLDFWSADEPRLLNKQVYRNTDCGASISVMLMNGTWILNGREGWSEMTRETDIRAFTIQTIVEGSDATVDSAPFYLPVKTQEVEDWIKDMEAQASDLWNRDNLDHYRVKLEGDWWGCVSVGDSEPKFDTDDDSELPEVRTELAALFEQGLMREPAQFGWFTKERNEFSLLLNHVTVTLESYTPDVY
jgi:hypothetical protein